MSSSENILQLILEMQQKIQKIIIQSEYLSIGADPTKKFSINLPHTRLSTILIGWSKFSTNPGSLKRAYLPILI